MIGPLLHSLTQKAGLLYIETLGTNGDWQIRLDWGHGQMRCLFAADRMTIPEEIEELVESGIKKLIQQIETAEPPTRYGQIDQIGSSQGPIGPDVPTLF